MSSRGGAGAGAFFSSCLAASLWLLEGGEAPFDVDGAAGLFGDSMSVKRLLSGIGMHVATAT